MNNIAKKIRNFLVFADFIFNYSCVAGWRWEKNGVGMGGKEAGPATEIKEGLGKDYPVSRFCRPATVA